MFLLALLSIVRRGNTLLMVFIICSFQNTNPASEKLEFSSEYKELLEGLKHKIRSSQVRAALAVNRELILLYYEIRKFWSDKRNKVGDPK